MTLSIVFHQIRNHCMGSLQIMSFVLQCLSVLNYFRSVERTLTINDGGLSLGSGTVKR